MSNSENVTEKSSTGERNAGSGVGLELVGDDEDGVSGGICGLQEKLDKPIKPDKPAKWTEINLNVPVCFYFINYFCSSLKIILGPPEISFWSC